MDKSIIGNGISLPIRDRRFSNLTCHDKVSANDPPNHFNQAECNDSTKDNPSWCACPNGKGMQLINRATKEDSRAAQPAFRTDKKLLQNPW